MEKIAFWDEIWLIFCLLFFKKMIFLTPKDRKWNRGPPRLQLGTQLIPKMFWYFLPLSPKILGARQNGQNRLNMDFFDDF